jgi:hypothetical protein
MEARAWTETAHRYSCRAPASTALPATLPAPPRELGAGRAVNRKIGDIVSPYPIRRSRTPIASGESPGDYHIIETLDE